MSVTTALERTTLQWRQVRQPRSGWQLRAGDEVVAHAEPGRLRLGNRVLRTETARGGITILVDVATGARVASIRELASGPASLSVGDGRYRLVRKGVLPLHWQVTAGIGGPQVLRILKLGETIRVRAGAAVDRVPPHDLDLLTALTGMRMLGLLRHE